MCCASYLTQIHRLVLRHSKLFLGLLQTPLELGLTSLLNGHRPQAVPLGIQGRHNGGSERDSPYAVVAPYALNRRDYPNGRVRFALKNRLSRCDTIKSSQHLST